MRGLVLNTRYHYTIYPTERGTRGVLIILLLIQCCQASYWHPILLFVILILLVILVIGVKLKLVILLLSPRRGAGRMGGSMSQVLYPGTLMSARVGIPTLRPRHCFVFSLSYYPYFTIYTSISVYNLICTDPASLCWRTAQSVDNLEMLVLCEANL